MPAYAVLADRVRVPARLNPKRCPGRDPFGPDHDLPPVERVSPPAPPCGAFRTPGTAILGLHGWTRFRWRCPGTEHLWAGSPRLILPGAMPPVSHRTFPARERRDREETGNQQGRRDTAKRSQSSLLHNYINYAQRCIIIATYLRHTDPPLHRGPAPIPVTPMSRRQKDTDRRGYHHGNLRQALVDAVLDLIEKHGPSGFSFSEAARAAGVSPAAPYRHFKDRDALIAEVAEKGFERLADKLEAAFDTGGPSPMRAFEAVTAAYLDFAAKERAFFLAMFQAGPPDSDEVLKAGDRAFDVLRRACEGLVRHMPAAERPPIHMMAYHVWSLTHGIAELFGQRDRRRRAPIEAAELLEAGTAIYLRGLGLIDQR